MKSSFRQLESVAFRPCSRSVREPDVRAGRVAVRRSVGGAGARRLRLRLRTRHEEVGERTVPVE